MNRLRALRVSLVGTGLAVAGCPGSLDDPSRFELSLAQCEPKVEALFSKTCAVSGCHSTADRSGDLDLASPGVAGRLVGVLSTNADCAGMTLAEPANPGASLLYRKLLDAPPCGARMPFLGDPLPAADAECVKIWIASLRGADGGVPDAGIADASVPNRPDGATVTPQPIHDAAVMADAHTPAPVGTGLSGEYFDEVNYTASKLTRIDPVVDFLWAANQSPAPEIAADGVYSAQWKGEVHARYGEIYTFYAASDDGVRLVVNGTELFNDMTGHAVTEFRGTVALSAGERVPIELDWFNSQGTGEIHLSWSSASQPREIIPQDQLFPTP